MFCFIIFYLNRLVSGNDASEIEKKHLIIDFGGKYLKGALDNYSPDSFLYLTKKENNVCDSPYCYLIPNSISAAVDDMMSTNTSEEAVRVGQEAFIKARKNKLLGIEFFGAIYNRKRKYISSNCDFFNIDNNVTISDFPLFWYLIQFFTKYQNKTLADDLTIILPGYSTDVTFEELKVANNQTFKKINFFRDFEIIQKVHSNLFSKSENKNVLYLDFGAFSVKATVVNRQNEVVFYDFDDQIGIEKVAYSRAPKDQEEEGKDKTNKRKRNEKDLYDNRVSKAREEAYKAMENVSFYDELFERNLNELIQKAKSRESAIDEIILIGGGCQFPFVRKTVESLSKEKKTVLIDTLNLNHSTFFIDGYKLTLNDKNLPSSNKFIYHPLFVKYNGQTHKIPEFSEQSYQFKINLGKIQRIEKVNQSSVWNNQFKIVTDESHVISGMSKAVLNLEFELNETDSIENKFIQISGSFSDGREKCENSFCLNFEAELCDVNDDKEIECKEKVSVVRSNVTVIKSIEAQKRARETDAAMGMIRALFSQFSQAKNKKKSEEL